MEAGDAVTNMELGDFGANSYNVACNVIAAVVGHAGSRELGSS